MHEIRFIKENREEWLRIEKHIHGQTEVPPDVLSELYIQLTDDLAYAQAHYPESNAVKYLNQLAVKAHQSIYRKKRERKGRLKQLFTTEIPLAVRRNYRFMGYSAVIFCISIAIGIVSAHLNPSYVNTILSDSYVNMTLENIEQEDPMAVYKKMGETEMFFMISTNNVRVAFLTYIFGIMAGIPTGLLLMYNGVMVGAFLFFFIERGLGAIALSTIFLHGALELTAIVLAGGCGLMLGAAAIFPGTYGRMYALRKQARESLKILFGVVPFIVLAAIIESFVTRYYLEMGEVLRLITILGSFSILAWYVFIYPRNIKTMHDAEI